MAFSMTGFGRGEAAGDTFKISCEIRAVNHRYFDFGIRMPRALAHLEDRVRKQVSEMISRGKVDVVINRDETGMRERTAVTDTGLAKAYIEASRALCAQFGIRDDLSVTTLLRIPEVVRIVDAEPREDEVWDLLSNAVSGALDVLKGMRKVEGERLSRDILKKLEIIEKHLFAIDDRAPEILVEYRVRLLARLSELLGQSMPDENRIAQEIALFADKCCIDEEIVRLKSHIAQTRENLTECDFAPVGRKLDFIIQEINREVNTIGSKANDKTIGMSVVEMKSEIEKIREQIQNIE